MSAAASVVTCRACGEPMTERGLQCTPCRERRPPKKGQASPARAAKKLAQRAAVEARATWDGGVLVVSLPLPPAEVSKNARVHWGEEAAATRAYRTAAHLACRAARAAPGWAAAETEAVFYFPNRRRRDRDNFGGMLKAAWDGLADAGVVENDSGFVHLPPVLDQVDAARPRVELRVWQKSEAARPRVRAGRGSVGLKPPASP